MNELRSREEILSKLDEFNKSLDQYSGGDEFTAYRDGVTKALEWVLKNNIKPLDEACGWG